MPPLLQLIAAAVVPAPNFRTRVAATFSPLPIGTMAPIRTEHAEYTFTHGRRVYSEDQEIGGA